MVTTIAMAWRPVELVEKDGAEEAVEREAKRAGAEVERAPGYLLVRGPPGAVTRLAAHPMVRRVLWGSVSDFEVERMRQQRAVSQPAPSAPVGARVRLLAGPAKGLVGEVLDVTESTLLVQVTLRCRVVDVQVETTEVEAA